MDYGLVKTMLGQAMPWLDEIDVATISHWVIMGAHFSGIASDLGEGGLIGTAHLFGDDRLLKLLTETNTDTGAHADLQRVRRNQQVQDAALELGLLNLGYWLRESLREYAPDVLSKILTEAWNAMRYGEQSPEDASTSIGEREYGSADGITGDQIVRSG
jgi:hypothetical protein